MLALENARLNLRQKWVSKFLRIYSKLQRTNGKSKLDLIKLRVAHWRKKSLYSALISKVFKCPLF